MINNKKLQKVVLPPDTIDLSFGEPKIIREALMRQIDGKIDMPSTKDLAGWEYQLASGKPDLASLLEKKYNAKVVVCNGAKQALSAAFYAMRKNGTDYIVYDKPYYPATPSLISLSGLVGLLPDEVDHDFWPASNVVRLLTSPNNPDGDNLSNIELIEHQSQGQVIHDAAYYTDIYLPDNQIPIPIGNIQIYSVSKMYGLSGIRIGYAVCHKESLYNDVAEYIELTSAGVSAASQDIIRNVEQFFMDNPEKLSAFHNDARSILKKNRALLTLLDQNVLMPMPCKSNSMFAWFKKGPKFDQSKVKVYMLDGVIFGDQDMVRMNIAVPHEVLKEAIDRLNNI